MEAGVAEEATGPITEEATVADVAISKRGKKVLLQHLVKRTLKVCPLAFLPRENPLRLAITTTEETTIGAPEDIAAAIVAGSKTKKAGKIPSTETTPTMPPSKVANLSATSITRKA